jgi:hypothetical protein
LEVVEDKFRKTSVMHSKYYERLTDYINGLIDRGRILEANHFFNLLYKEKGNNRITIRIGYFLAIKLFDSEKVRFFDSLFIQSVQDAVELDMFRLDYYYSMGNGVALEECCRSLLSKKLSDEQLSIIVGFCINKQSYEIARNLVDHLGKNKKTLNKYEVKEIRKIIITRLVEVITLRAKYG